jgi:hypothetical protein
VDNEKSKKLLKKSCTPLQVWLIATVVSMAEGGLPVDKVKKKTSRISLNKKVRKKYQLEQSVPN